MLSRDTRTLYEKLISLATDPGATPSERLVAAQKADQLKRKQAEALRQEKMSPAEKAYYDFINKQFKESVDPNQPNAGWTFKPEMKRPNKRRMKRAYLKPRSQRVHKTFYTILMREAQERAKYREKYWESLFGLRDHPSVLEARARITKLMGMPDIERHICLINGKLTKLHLFWHFGISRDITWFFIERDTVTGKTKKSKRYFTRDAAMHDFQNDVITWTAAEVI